MRIVWMLTQSNWMKCHRWLCICYRNDSPSRSLSLQSGHPCRPGPSHTRTLLALTPWGRWPQCRMIWAQTSGRFKKKRKYDWLLDKFYYCNMSWFFPFWQTSQTFLLCCQQHKLGLNWKQLSLNVLAEYRIELFGDVVLLVFDLWPAQLDDHVWISLPIDISRMKICSLG